MTTTSLHFHNKQVFHVVDSRGGGVCRLIQLIDYGGPFPDSVYHLVFVLTSRKSSISTKGERTIEATFYFLNKYICPAFTAIF